MPQPTVLISGAGIAGPALAHWLTKSGYHVTIVEIADGIRPGGQTVDLRGAGGDVAERMGLIGQMRECSLDQRGIAWIKADGSLRAEMPVTAFNGNGVVSKLEILRGDLVDVLYQATKDHAEYRFDTRIAEITQSDGAVEARLTDGTTLSADLIVGADGPHSAVRRLVVRPRRRIRQTPRRVQRVVHGARHRRTRRLVSDVSGTRSQRVNATIARTGAVQGRTGVSIRTHRV
jgi:2-polyprenyl-6-methoxyphenol hydroxylase-like FAD-dependent oxidoreductase